MRAQTSSDTRNLARFRRAIRKFLHFSDEAARQVGLTPQHHQLLLGIAGFTGRRWATIGELAEFLQLRHHSVVGLVDRAEALGLVSRAANPKDRREVRVSLTADGLRKLRLLAPMHRKELSGMRRSLNLFVLERAGSSREAALRPVRGRRKT